MLLVTPNLKVKPAASIVLEPAVSQNSSKCQFWSPLPLHASEATEEAG